MGGAGRRRTHSDDAKLSLQVASSSCSVHGLATLHPPGPAPRPTSRRQRATSLLPCRSNWRNRRGAAQIGERSRQKRNISLSSLSGRYSTIQVEGCSRSSLVTRRETMSLALHSAALHSPPPAPRDATRPTATCPPPPRYLVRARRKVCSKVENNPRFLLTLMKRNRLLSLSFRSGKKHDSFYNFHNFYLSLRRPVG